MTDQPPILLYRRATEHPIDGGTGRGPGDTSRANQILRALTWAILAVVLALWAVLGAVFWIPLLLRSMVMFTVTLIEATLEGKRPGTAARILREAVTFYRRGFVVATDVILRDKVGEESAAGPTEGRLFREVLWAIVIWYFILLILGFVETSPIDAWRWWASLPWGDAFAALIEPLRL